ncbi:unnamed protein product [Diamesa hyperborea]
MLSLLSEIKFWTCKDDLINVRDSDFGAFKYHERKESDKNQYTVSKKDYAEKRGLVWNPKNKQPSKLKNSLRIFEEELKSKKVVYCEWTDQKTIQLMLSNGLLVYLEINVFTGDIKRINFDKYFIGKVISESICDVIITRQHIIISYNENQITFVHLQKPSMKSSTQKLSMADPKIFNIIIGGQTKKINRNLVVNPSCDLLVVWTKSSQNEFFPWRPTEKQQERANLHIYKLNRLKLELLCYYWTENDPICFEFSKFNDKEIHSVEQKISRKGDVTIESCTYHISYNKTKIQRTSVTSIPLQMEVCCSEFSPDHEKLIMGCIDGSIVLFDEGRGITYLVKASFIPFQVSWHPDSAVVMIANERGQLQCFDISLSCVKNQLLSEDVTPSNILDLSSFFTIQPTLLKLCWSRKPDINNHYEKYAQTDCFLLLLFDTGIFASLRYVGGAGLKNDIQTSGLTADVIIHMYINLNQIEKAINILLSLNWDTYGAMCLLSLHKIANNIFQQTLTSESEVLLQKALGSFHVPTKPLCLETENEFGDQVDDITRRFFHYLMKYKSFEKAFSLAIDINDADLFMILYKVAKMHGYDEMAEESSKKAEEIYVKEENDSHHSTCSITSCSICSDGSETEEEDDRSSRSSEPQDPSLNITQSTDQESPGFKKDSSPMNKLKKSFSADILNHPPLPRFPRYDVKKYQRTSVEPTIAGPSNYIPPLPFVSQSRGSSADKNVPPTPEEQYSKINIQKPELTVTNERSQTMKKKNASMTNLSNELTFQNLNKFNYTSMDEFNNNPTYNPLGMPSPHLVQSHSVIDIVPNPKGKPDLDQTIGIPLTYDTTDDVAGNYFQPQTGASASYYNNNEIKNEYDYQIPTTVHQYPLISGTIPTSIGSQAKMTLPPTYSTTMSSPKKKDPAVPTSSILSTSNNTNATNTSNANSKKESGEKNKVKFSDTVHISVVPEIPRKEKMPNFGERVKRKTVYPMMTDPRRELRESLPLSHPNEDYLKDFTPMIERSNPGSSSSNNKNGNEEKQKKPSIKVVHFGVV